MCGRGSLYDSFLMSFGPNIDVPFKLKCVLIPSSLLSPQLAHCHRFVQAILLAQSRNKCHCLFTFAFTISSQANTIQILDTTFYTIGFR